MSKSANAVVTFLLLLAAVAGLLMSFCGGFFTLTMLGPGKPHDFLVLSVPSLVIGLLLLWLACRKL